MVQIYTIAVVVSILIAIAVLFFVITDFNKQRKNLPNVNRRRKVKENFHPEITNGYREGFLLKDFRETERDYIFKMLPVDSEIEGVQPEIVEFVIPKQYVIENPGKAYNDIYFVSPDPSKYSPTQLSNPFIKSLFDKAKELDAVKFMAEGWRAKQEQDHKAFKLIAKGINDERFKKEVERITYVEDKRIELKNKGEKKI